MNVFRNATKAIGKNITQSVNRITHTADVLVNGASDLPPSCQQFLKQHGQEIIKTMQIVRSPIPGMIQKTLEVLSNNKNDYDTLYHLALIISSVRGNLCITIYRAALYYIVWPYMRYTMSVN